jgi:hypothetical protein
MNMQKADGLVNGQAGQQMGANTASKVNDILADYIINEHDSLFQSDSGSPQSLKQSKVNVLLLFSTKQVHQSIGYIAAMPCTCNGCYPSFITCLGCQKGIHKG